MNPWLKRMNTLHRGGLCLAPQAEPHRLEVEKEGFWFGDLVETKPACCDSLVESSSFVGAPPALESLPGAPGSEDDGLFATLPRLVLDIETYYNRCYNLKNMHMIPYVYHKSFHVHGVAVWHPDGRYDLHQDVPALLDALRHEYGAMLESVILVCHNAKFDYFVLHRLFGLRAARLADTMLMSRLLYGAQAGHSLREVAQRLGLPKKGDLDFMCDVKHPSPDQWRQLREYAVRDVSLTATMADYFITKLSGNPLELWTIDHSVRMFAERPLRVDGRHVRQAFALFERNLLDLVKATGHTEQELRSTKGFPLLLKKALAKTGRSVPLKKGRRGPVIALAKGDPERERLLDDPHPEVRALVRAHTSLRAAAQHRSRLEYLLKGGAVMGGRCSFEHNYCGAVTGRFSSGGGFNIQNLKKGDMPFDGTMDAAGIRRAIKAAQGCLFVAADASQIEPRVLAFLSGQRDLHDAFADGRDVYSEFAATHLHREVRKPRDTDTPAIAEELTRLRHIGKQAFVGLGYGMGVAVFIQRLGMHPKIRPLFEQGMLNDPRCAEIVHGFRRQYPCIKTFWNDCERAALDAIHGQPGNVGGLRFSAGNLTLRIRLLSGRDLVYPGVRVADPTFTKRAYLDENGQRAFMEEDQPRMTYQAGPKTIDLYGGKFVENIVQATARDLLLCAMRRVEATGIPIYLHCHDSITTQVPAERAGEAERILLDAWSLPPEWIAGLVLDAEASTGSTLADL